MYSNIPQQGYTPENFPTGLDPRTMNVNPPMYSMDQIQNTSQFQQHSSGSLGRTFEENINSNSTQDFNYQQNLNLPMQNQGYYSNDLSNQNPYYGSYMYNPNGWQNNPNTWAYQQQQQMQMQQLYHYYQYMQQQQNPNGFEQSDFQNDFSQLSLNTEETVSPQEDIVALPEIKHVEESKPISTNTQEKPSTPKTFDHKKKPETHEVTKAPPTWAQKVAKNSKEASSTQNVQRNIRPKTNKFENRSQNTKNDQTKPFKQQDRQHINHKNTSGHQHKQHNAHQHKPHYNQRRPHHSRQNQKGQYIPNNNSIKLNNEEYEFTESNTIDRDEIEIKGDVSVGYDKNSFFDNLGEDDKKDENENKSFKESRVQDKETFGTTRRPYRRNHNNPRHKQNYRLNQKAKS